MYAEVTVIVDGALDEDATFHDEPLMRDFIESIKDEAPDHGYPTSVFVIYHDHDESTDCECVQFLTDHHPYWTNEGDDQ